MSLRPPHQSRPSAGVQLLLDSAVRLHQAGRFAEAAQIYRSIIAQLPGHFDATHLLGVIDLQEGRLEQAQGLISSALRINPRDPAALGNLGAVYLRQRRFELAREQFELAVKVRPNSADGLLNLGTALRELGRPREALAPLRQAHSLDPRSSVLCNLLGACLLDVGDAAGAAAFFESATVTSPDDAAGWGNLAVALNRMAEHARARECADKAVALRPESSAALAARAAIEFEQDQIETAIVTYRQAAALPDPSTQTLCAFANALWTSGRCDEALAELKRSVALDGNNAMALWKLAVSECRPYYDDATDIESSRRAFGSSLSELQEWFRAAPRPEAFAAVGSTQPFFIAYQAFNNKDLLSRYGDLCTEWMATMPMERSPAVIAASATRGSSAVGRKLRIGIASAHIRDHSVWNAITKGWVEHLDKTRFDIWLFQLGRTSDAETASAKRQATQFEDRPKTLQAWAGAINDARLDVLIYPEIGMDALTVQLASLRLAPVQAASWGHPETTGLPTIDLYLSAEGLEPPGAQGNYRERLALLPNLGVYVEPLAPASADPDLVSLGLPVDEPLLLCPGTPYKYSPVYDPVWARIAKGLQTGEAKGGWGGVFGRKRRRSVGRLVFFLSGNTSVDGLLTRRLRRAFEAEKVDFDAVVCQVPYLTRPRFFGLMQRAALMLDTVGFSGFNNALQAVEAGLPVLARETEFMRGRLASSIMRRMDLPELVAASNDEFIECAIRLAMDPAKCRLLRAGIASRRGVLYRDLEAIRGLERCLVEAVERREQGGPEANVVR